MQDAEPPKIEYPCEYPIKVMGVASEDFEAAILAVFDRIAPGYDRDKTKMTPSRKGTFCSLTVVINATSEAQIMELFEALKATGRVKMVL